MGKIFLFEDEDGQAYYLIKYLSKYYTVYHFSSVAELDIDDVLEQDYSLFLLDIMGKKDNKEGLIFAKKLREAGIFTPIIFTTALGVLPEVINQAYEIGDCKVLVRPHSMGALGSQIKDSLGE
jgi:DNA-binding response OmpR family regulator